MSALACLQYNQPEGVSTGQPTRRMCWAQEMSAVACLQYNHPEGVSAGHLPEGVSAGHLPEGVLGPGDVCCSVSTV